MNTTTNRHLVQPALIGGLVMGVLSALPIVSVGNLCCCLWLIIGGVVAAYLLQQDQPAPITPGDGALVGLLAGVFGAVIQVIVSIPITLVLGPMERALVQRVLDMAGSTPPELRDLFERYSRDSAARGAVLAVTRIFVLGVWLCLGAIFSTIGGVIGAAIFKKPAQPGTIVDVTPPPA